MIESEIPLGLCKVCARPLIEADKKKVCPVHGIKPEGPPSGLIVTSTDPGEESYKLIVNSKGYAERVEQEDPRPVATEVQLQQALNKQTLESRAGTAAKFGINRVVTTSEEPPEADRARPIPSSGGLVYVPVGVLEVFLATANDSDVIGVKLSEQSLNELYELVDNMPPPAS